MPTFREKTVYVYVCVHMCARMCLHVRFEEHTYVHQREEKEECLIRVNITVT